MSNITYFLAHFAHIHNNTSVLFKNFWAHSPINNTLGFDSLKLLFSSSLYLPTQKYIRICLGKTTTIWNFLARFAHLNKNKLGFDLVKQLLFEIFWLASFAYTKIY